MGPQDINEETQQSDDDNITGNAAYIQHLTKTSGVIYNPADEISAIFVSTESTFTTVSTSNTEGAGLSSAGDTQHRQYGLPAESLHLISKAEYTHLWKTILNTDNMVRDAAQHLQCSTSDSVEPGGRTRNSAPSGNDDHSTIHSFYTSSQDKTSINLFK